MIKRMYSFMVSNYDYFDHYRSNYDQNKIYTFTNLKEAFNAYKESIKKDFYWEGDHERETHPITKEWVYIPETQQKHGRVLGYKPEKQKTIWELSPEEIEELFNQEPPKF